MTFSSWGHLSALVFFLTDHSGNFYQMQKLHLTIRANSIAFYHSMKRRTENAFSVARRSACMERPARRRSSPMELAKRPNPLTQQHCDPFSKHGLWRCDCTESEQKPPKPLFCVQWISMTVAPGERTTAGLGCSPGCGPTVRVADPEVADPAHAQRGMPRVRHKRGVFFRPSVLSTSILYRVCYDPPQ